MICTLMKQKDGKILVYLCTMYMRYVNSDMNVLDEKMNGFERHFGIGTH
jgi:hypothetical protein